MSSLWIDPQNPALSPVGGLSSSDIQWVRPSQLGANPSLFVDGSEEGDVCQGALGDCWFLGALSVLGTREDLLHHCVVSTHPEQGYYEFQFFKQGKWVTVKIDDRIPARDIGNGTLRPIYARSPDPNELWVCLMEKAYAKLHGKNYSNLDGGQVDYALVDLTGGVTDSGDLGKMTADQVWQKLTWAVQEAWLMGCANISSGAVAESQLGGTGILVNHAYGIIDARVVKGERLLRVRNPWGKTEWTGRWSDQSSEWTPALLAELNFELGDDGTFWIALDDFMRYYNRLYVVRLYHDDIGKQWQRHVVEGKWHAGNSGGCVNNDSWIKNPQVGFKNSGSAPVRLFLQLAQTDTRYSGSPASTVGFVVFKSEDNTKRTVNAYQKDVALSTTYTNTRDVNHEFVAEPGQQYVVTVSTFDAGVTGDYALILWSEEAIDVHVLPDTDGAACRAVPARAIELGSGVDADDLAMSSAPKKSRAAPKLKIPRGRSSKNNASASAATASSNSSSSAVSNTSQKNNSSQSAAPAASSGPYSGSKDANGQPHGQGRYVFEAGDVFEGTFDHGSKASGVYKFAHGDSYSGQFKDDQFHGHGLLKYAAGGQYDGEWVNGSRHGQGTFTHANGDTFQGTYSQNQRNGPGVMKFSNGDVEEGNFVNGQLNGQGTFKFADGAIYTGSFVQGEMTGVGTLQVTQPEVSTYTGSFVSGLRHGRGSYRSSGGDLFEGEYKDNQMHQGRFQRGNGDVYEGSFEGGAPHGQGKYTTHTGRVIEGIFNHGKAPSS